MIRIIIALMIVTFSISLVKSQNYESIFGRDSTRWSYYTDYGGADFWATIIFYSGADTIIDAKSYKILNSEYIEYDYARFGYLREDTVLGNVWFLPLDVEEEILYYDLSLNAGDTFTSRIPSGICSYEIVNKVSIENDRKIIEFNDFSFIEGIGSTNGFFNFTEWGCNRLSELLCVFKDGIQTYSNPEGCFKPYRVSIESLELKTIKIFPNPAHNKLMIDFGQDIETENKISLFDIIGQKLIMKQTNLQKLEIDLRRFKDGIYFLRLNNTLTRKIVINRY